MKLSDLVVAFVAWCAIVGLGIAMVRFIDGDDEPQLVIANASSGQWDFTNTGMTIPDVVAPPHPQPAYTFAPCPVGPQNVPQRQERVDA